MQAAGRIRRVAATEFEFFSPSAEPVLNPGLASPPMAAGVPTG
ncbi:hypothetical protein [Microbulbifer sp. VAAF005]|nr:hypothetical protein [Microbulbifer sp. VAAF005]WHI44711.1 hypothetical protein P0078_13250 [Microbulbifer sp. VAAF005]